MCVLLVEDDPVTRMAAAGALRRDGHEVEEAPDKVAGLAAFERHPERFSIVVADFRPSGILGWPDIASHVHACRPGLPVVVASADRELLEAYWQQDGDFIVLRKPYRAHELLHLVWLMTRNVD